MVKNILNERYDYQQQILSIFNDNGYQIRKNKDLQESVQRYAIDREVLFKFLYNTQPEKMESLGKIYHSSLEETILNAIDVAETKKSGSRLNVLKQWY